MTTDHVCGMAVSETEARHQLNHNGETYYFCSARCQEIFAKQPGKYLKPRKKGIFSRFLERLAKENSRTFGNTGPSCH